jgi:ATP-binding cassette subfamily B protein
MTAALQENLTGIRVVRAFSRQPEERLRFAGFNATFRDHNRRLIDLMGVYWSTSDLLCLTQLGIVLFAGAYQLQAGTLSVGELFAFLTWEGMVIFPLRQFGRILTDAGKASVALTRLRAILEAAPEPQGIPEAAPRRPLALALDRLTFTYPGAATPALRDLTLSVAPGETLAILGAPGAGKSTLLRLLLRYYEAPAGAIALGLSPEALRPLEHWPLGALRGALAIVAQDPFLYGRSLEENLRVGAPEASEAELWIALEDGALAETVRGLPAGLATALGERGVTLSGGQRQRLAIARALLRRPALLLLDDALSAVDVGTEAHILRALQQRKGESTVILTAHRLSTVRHADRIALLEDGQLVALGDHGTLLRACAPYRTLAQQQGYAP